MRRSSPHRQLAFEVVATSCPCNGRSGELRMDAYAAPRIPKPHGFECLECSRADVRGAARDATQEGGGARLEPSVSSPCEWDASQLS